MTDPIRIYNLTKNVVRVHPIFGYEAAIMVGAAGVDVFVSALDGTESYRVRLEGPKPGQKVDIKRIDDGAYDVRYEDVQR